MFNRMKEFLLNTPEKYWLVLFGYHIHKSFWGVVFTLIGITLLVTRSLILGTVSFIVGIILLVLSIYGHIYTNNRPYFKLWDKYEK